MNHIDKLVKYSKKVIHDGYDIMEILKSENLIESHIKLPYQSGGTMFKSYIKLKNLSRELVHPELQIFYRKLISFGGRSGYIRANIFQRHYNGLVYVLDLQDTNEYEFSIRQTIGDKIIEIPHDVRAIHINEYIRLNFKGDRFGLEVFETMVAPHTPTYPVDPSAPIAPPVVYVPRCSTRFELLGANRTDFFVEIVDIGLAHGHAISTGEKKLSFSTDKLVKDMPYKIYVTDRDVTSLYSDYIDILGCHDVKLFYHEKENKFKLTPPPSRISGVH